AEQAGEGRLATPGRSPQDQRRNGTAGGEVTEDASRRDEVRLADQLLERARPHPVGQWLADLPFARALGEQVQGFTGYTTAGDAPPERRSGNAVKPGAPSVARRLLFDSSM